MSEQLISSRMTLDSILQLQREGFTPTMQYLEAAEPELANYLCELTCPHSSIHPL